MIPHCYKFGGFFLYMLKKTKQGYVAALPGKATPGTVSDLSTFFQKRKDAAILAVNASREIHLAGGAINRLMQVAEDTDAGIVYADYFEKKDSGLVPRPLIDYQEGSIRDDFNFGDVILFSTAAVKSVLKKYGRLPRDPDLFFYDLRLKIALDRQIFHIPEFLYEVAADQKKVIQGRKAGAEKQFAYVAAANAERQKKLERVATNYLKLKDAWLTARTKKADGVMDSFPVCASVVIPVYNRKKTIHDALQSALAQKTDFDFNIIVVDNHSTDGTTEAVAGMAGKYSKIKHLIPRRYDLSIGGCWNEAVYSPYCGRWAVQLDSDDLYSTTSTLQKIVNLFRKDSPAMVIGSYTIVDERLKKIPPGLIDHREWTTANGHNNALRINGLGAPRAFDTAVLRQVGFPNVGYGEDYAVALRITREYRISRIYESLYLCRRWSDNTDAALSVERQNRHDFYKDKLRTIEIRARQMINKEGSY